MTDDEKAEVLKILEAHERTLAVCRACAETTRDLAWEVNEKIEQWLDAGVNVLWEVQPGTKSVMVHRPAADAERLRADDFLTLPDLIPDFRVRVGDVFPPSDAG